MLRNTKPQNRNNSRELKVVIPVTYFQDKQKYFASFDETFSAFMVKGETSRKIYSNTVKP